MPAVRTQEACALGKNLKLETLNLKLRDMLHTIFRTKNLDDILTALGHEENEIS